jgi:hypothetical protein
VTVEVRMRALAAEGLSGKDFELTDDQLRHHIDPSRDRELRELIKQSPFKRRRLAKFLPENQSKACGNGHAETKFEDVPKDNSEPARQSANGHDRKIDPDQIDEAIIRGLAGVRTEDRLPLDLVERHGLNLRYVAAWGQWLEWTGANWEPEKTFKAYDLARKICREAASECDTPTEKKMLLKGKPCPLSSNLPDPIGAWPQSSINGIQIICYSTPQAETMIMSVDLASGNSVPNRHEDYCTRIAGTAMAEPGPVLFGFRS